MRSKEFNSKVDDETIEQLVDGQLNGRRYGEVIGALDRSVDGWRRCAIAFLEEQALKQELRSVARFGLDAALRDGAGQSSVTATEQSVADPNSTSNSMSTLRLIGKYVNFLALAASVMFAFGLGRFSADNRLGDSRPPAWPANSNDTSIASVASPDASAFDPLTYLEQDFGIVPLRNEIPAALRELESSGVARIETTNAVYPIQLEDGRSAIIPVQNIRVRPVLNAY